MPWCHICLQDFKTSLQNFSLQFIHYCIDSTLLIPFVNFSHDIQAFQAMVEKKI